MALNSDNKCTNQGLIVVRDQLLVGYSLFDLLLPNTKRAKDFAKQVVGGEFTSDLIEVLLGKA